MIQDGVPSGLGVVHTDTLRLSALASAYPYAFSRAILHAWLELDLQLRTLSSAGQHGAEGQA